MRIISKFFLKTKKEKEILILTIFYIIFTQILIKIFPFKFIIKILNLKKAISITDGNLNYIKEIKWALGLCSKNLFWKSLCLNQSLTAYKLLKIYNNKPYLYIGINKINNEILAHAWIMVNKNYIIGETPEKYNIISIFE